MAKVSQRQVPVCDCLVNVESIVPRIESVPAKAFVVAFQFVVVNLVVLNLRTSVSTRDKILEDFFNRSTACLTVVKKESLLHFLENSQSPNCRCLCKNCQRIASANRRGCGGF